MYKTSFYNLFVPYKDKVVYANLLLVYGDLFEKAYALLGKNYAEVRRAKQYQQQISERSIDRFFLYNRHVIEANSKSKSEKMAL